jgi:O-antigen/teichoic acid export membrane protein
VLGSRWSHATPVIQILAAVGIIQSLQTLTGEVLLALDRSGTLLRFTLLWFAGIVGSVVLGLHWGTLGVATCYAGATVLIEPIRTYITTRALGIPMWTLGRALVGILQAAALMAVALLLARTAFVAAGLSPAVRLVLLVAIGSFVYLAACAWRAPEVTSEIHGAIKRRRRPAAPLEPLEAGL